MKVLRVVNRSRNQVLGTRIGLADRWWLRLRGLLGRPGLAAGEGLLLSPCTSIHTFGMGYPIDVAFLDRDGKVVATYADLPPRRATRLHRDAVSALELPAGTLTATDTSLGHTLLMEGAAG